MRLGAGRYDNEWLTRKSRIDPRLDVAGWRLRTRRDTALREPYRTEEEETDSGPADYALWLDSHVAAVVEAKKLTIGPQNVLVQAERYARGLGRSPYNFDGLRAPFLYATNGEVLWFHDVRHPLNRSRRVADFHTPNALRELLGCEHDAAAARLLVAPNDHPRLRPYQQEANAAIERAIADRKRHMLVAMATGTGKTFTLVNQIYRLMKCGVSRRVLFLVDRRALAAQAVRAFASFEAEPGQKFDAIYEVYSSRFQREDFGDEDRFDPTVLPSAYLTDPKPGHAFVYVCTVQRMAINLFGRGAVFGDDVVDEDADRLDIPIHAFDTVVADECHRGYTAAQQSVWRNTLDHFDAVKIGLTATPAAHTTSYFQHLVYRYDYRRAVEEGYLADYDVVNIRSNVRMNGVFLQEGEQVERVDPESGATQLDLLEDERRFESAEIEATVTAPDSNRRIIEEVKTYALAHEALTGRFPKTLIFAVNDLPHTSHANQLVSICRDLFERGDAFVQKITGGKDVDRPLQRIREFRNRPNPAIAVTVDLLSTGVDIPDLEFIVFLRPVKSRILFEQMLGRGTRKGERFPDKSHFTMFDCFDGTLLAYFRQATGVTEELPAPATRTIAEIIEDIWNNRDREFNVRCLVKRLHRIDRAMAGEARDDFAAFIPHGDLARFARGLPAALQGDFVETMALLRNPAFQALLVGYRRAPRTFIVAPGVQDEVRSEWIAREGGVEYKPADYLETFARFIRESSAHIEAVRILLDRPKDWSPVALKELREKLDRNFRLDKLQKAHELRYQRALVDIISMVKHAADEEQPLLTAAERVERAFQRLTARHLFTAEQQEWLERIRIHMIENLSIDRDDFELMPVFTREGGLGAAARVFVDQLDSVIGELNEAIAA